MCGILGALRIRKGAEGYRLKVLDRARRIRHRGPDWSGIYCKGKNILAHERLAIVDVESGSQPIISEDKNIILAVNGEIYNHKTIEKEIKNSSKYITNSDCEIILHLYEEASKNNDDSMEWINRLNGIFAFICLDEKNDRFIVARDHVGIIPLYMGHDEDGVIWVASELKCISDVCVTFEDFPPGHVYDSKTNMRTKWYKPKWEDIEYLPNKSIDYTEFREKLETAVKAQLMCDVPYGVLLSGGLDSSIIAAIASRICEKRIEDELKSPAWWPRLHTFSIGLANSPDLEAARIVANKINSVHHEFTFTIEEGLDTIPDVIYHLETYDVTTIRAATPMYLMCRKIKCLGVKMVLSGEGSDEMFGGYLYFHKCPTREDFQKELVNKLKLLHKYDFLRANKAGGAWGVEVRVPFQDKDFLDYAMNDINPLEKMCGDNAISPERKIEKYILRKAFEGYLPDNILWRQKEQFSDGVGYDWIDAIKDTANKCVSDEELLSAKYKFIYNTPKTKEAYYFRSIFEKYFPQQSAIHSVPGGESIACSTPTAVLWDSSFKEFADCSGRSVKGIHLSAYDEEKRQHFAKQVAQSTV